MGKHEETEDSRRGRMLRLHDMVADGEEWLMHRVLMYAREHGYTRYTSTLLEAWRTSVVGLSLPLLQLLSSGETVPPVVADDDFVADTIASFGILEARKHRARGVDLGRFLGLMKYYRRSYEDLVRESISAGEMDQYLQIVERYFDRVELGFSTEWGRLQQSDLVQELQDSNVAMTNEKNKFLTIFESLPSPALFIDERNRVINHNHAAGSLFFGRSTPGGNYYGSSEPQTLPAAIEDEILAFSESSATSRRLEKELPTSTGPCHFIILVKKMLDISGKFRGIVAICNDITSLRRMEEAIEALNTDLASRAFELERLNQELEAFNYSVSHDLRSPLSGISGYSQLLLSGPIPPDHDTFLEYMQQISHMAWRMEHLITTLMDFARLSRCELHREVFNLSTVAKATFLELRRSDRARHVVFVCSDRIMVDADPALVQVVMDNLLGNAWKYTGRECEARITFGRTFKNGKEVFFVRDNGVGFSMNQADMLFSPFQRLHTSEEFAGSGIGLATVDRIVRRHGGSVWAVGEPGKGATVYFSL